MILLRGSGTHSSKPPREVPATMHCSEDRARAVMGAPAPSYLSMTCISAEPLNAMAALGDARKQFALAVAGMSGFGAQACHVLAAVAKGKSSSCLESSASSRNDSRTCTSTCALPSNCLHLAQFVET